MDFCSIKIMEDVDSEQALVYQYVHFMKIIFITSLMFIFDIFATMGPTFILNAPALVTTISMCSVKIK